MPSSDIFERGVQNLHEASSEGHDFAAKARRSFDPRPAPLYWGGQAQDSALNSKL
jgi:hypothetical protein